MHTLVPNVAAPTDPPPQTFESAPLRLPETRYRFAKAD